MRRQVGLSRRWDRRRSGLSFAKSAYSRHVALHICDCPARCMSLSPLAVTVLCMACVLAVSLTCSRRVSSRDRRVRAQANTETEVVTKSRLVPFTSAPVEDLLVVDCTHPTAPSLTHHRGGKTPATVAADTSGGIVLNAAKAGHVWLSKNKVACNHFDMDGLAAVFAFLEPARALEHEELLRQAAHLGDFREMDLQTPTGHSALALNVWLNSVERALFYRPFQGSEAHGAMKKYEHFLPRLPGALALSDACAEFVETLAPKNCVLREAGSEFDTELSRVLADANSLADCGPQAVRMTPSLGLSVVDCPKELHYYALFSVTRGADTMLACYPGQRYELEHKYTGFVNVVSRPTVPRIDLTALAAALTEVEVARTGARDLLWVANSITDSGPLMRLERTSDGARKASKAERYMHPYERTILASSVQPAEMEQTVRSYLAHGLRGVKAKTGWTWTELQELNASIDWAAWRATCKLLVAPQTKETKQE